MPDPSRRREGVRRRILAAAVELLPETGYQRLTIEGIASRAGVGKQTIYRWWPTKGAVVLDAFLERQAVASDEAGELEVDALPETGDLDVDLRQVVRETVAEFSDVSFEAPYRALVVAIQDDATLAEQVLEKIVRGSDETVRAWLEGATRAAGLEPVVDAALVRDLLFGPILRRWLMRTAPLDQAFADELTDAVLRVLGHPVTPR